MNQIVLSKSSKKDKKWMVRLPSGKTVHFGAAGYQDYTQHKDTERKRRYIIRHQKREKWSKAGVTTAGFWSRWILWNQPSLLSSIRNTANKFKMNIKKR
uniref:DUF5754 protein n=1 Tax=Clandestinovirus TaxID=2831644 RepID=A0A8F8KT10_9VIRU|nr:DUF5754 protein [Clandestinovirus]